MEFSQRRIFGLTIILLVLVALELGLMSYENMVRALDLYDHQGETGENAGNLLGEILLRPYKLVALVNILGVCLVIVHGLMLCQKTSFRRVAADNPAALIRILVLFVLLGPLDSLAIFGGSYYALRIELDDITVTNH